ncbi:MAG: DNA primase [Chitinophagales bacterium]|nr:DNA primase [Chitinophagales bacterium]
MITESSIARVLETAHIEQVINEYVSLKKRGANFLGLCPFHNEKTPSFTVSPSKGIYKCFGCGVAGNVTKFLMEHEHYTFPEAVEFLAEKYQIDLEYTNRKESREEVDNRDSIHIINSFAKKVFIENLETEEGTSIALSYLKERGLNSVTIEKFGIGYALDSQDALMNKAKEAGFEVDKLAEAGLLSRDKSKDFFRNRIMFPIHNLSGKVIAFGGRTMKKNTKAPKYINTAESEVYLKSKVLYGMFVARNSIRKEDQCFLVEGYTDVIAMAQAGIENVVASSGTALTPDQIRLIKRYTEQITIIYDGDEAGKKAATRGGDIALEEGLKVSILVLPDGEDPDSFIRANGAAAFNKYFRAEETDYILFKVKKAVEASAKNPVKKAALTNEIISSVARVGDPISRSYYLKECSRILEINEQILIAECNKSRRNLLSKNRSKNEADASVVATETHKYISEQMDGITEESYLELLERDLIRLTMEYGPKKLDDEQTVTGYILEELENIEIDNSLYKETIDLIEKEFDKGNVHPQEFFLNNQNDRISELAIELLSSPYELSENWGKRYDIMIQDIRDNFQKDIQSSVTRFKLFKLKKMINENKQKMKDEKDEDQLKKLQETHVLLHKVKQDLSEILGTVVFK